MLIVKKISYCDPISVLQKFSDQKGLCFLDSARPSENTARYSFLVFNPFLKISAKANQVEINGRIEAGNPFLILQQQLKRFKMSRQINLPPFQGGAVGYFSYDLLRHLEKIPPHGSDPLLLPDMQIGFYDTVIAFDHQEKNVLIMSSGLSEEDIQGREQKAQANCTFVLDRMAQDIQPNTEKVLKLPKEMIRSNFTADTYAKSVQKIIDYIYAGDIFQANMSQCFSTQLPDDFTGLDLYLKLRRINPAPFAALLQYDDLTIISASPERFLTLQENEVETRPIKGTRARSADPEEDARLAKELLSSEKDRAENMMIVDLMRNDLSRVCDEHTVVVQQLCGLESFASVHHLVSVVKGRLRENTDAIDLLMATFPGGSITGAPKVRSMEIIAELEPTARGPYCGSIGYIGFDGSMDTSIVIRSFVKKGNKLTFQAGGGIIADSSPEEEYRETLTKAASLLKVLTE